MSVRSATLRPEQVILEAAVAAMFEDGYHGTSVRQIADRAGMSVANVYYHFPSKHELLFRLMDASATTLRGRLDELLAEGPPDPADRLARAVRLFVERHTRDQKTAFVAATELRALEPQARAAVVAQRDAIESIFRALVEDGVAAGVFAVDDMGLATRALLDMASSVSSWYRDGGRLAGSEVADRYATIALAIVGHRGR